MGEKTVMTAIVMKETLKETNRLKSNCSANSSIYALLMRPCLLLLLAMAMWPLHRIHAPKQHRNESCEHAICDITNPQSYCGDDSNSLFIKIVSALESLRFDSMKKLGVSLELHHFIAKYKDHPIAQVAAKCHGYISVCINICRKVIEEPENGQF